MFSGKVPFAIRLTLPILWYGLIFYLTELPVAQSSSTLEVAEEIAGQGGEWLNGVFRTSAHLFMFGVLGWLVYFLFTPSFSLQRKTMYKMLTVVAMCAFLDEVHQSLVPGRFFRIIDILVDTFGAFVFVWATTYCTGVVSRRLR